VVDETGFVKKGSHSVGVARQYCGRVGKRENCQVAASLSVATATASLPIAWRLYLPEQWANDRERREAAGVPPEVEFQAKPEMALAQIRQAVEDGVPPGVVLADEVYGSVRQFRDGVAALKLSYSLAVRSNTTVWALERQPLPPKPWPIPAPQRLSHCRCGQSSSDCSDKYPRQCNPHDDPGSISPSPRAGAASVGASARLPAAPSSRSAHTRRLLRRPDSSTR
jgi:SRSO17 transposase